MHFNQLSDNGQAQPRARCGQYKRIFPPVKTFEDTFLVFFCDPDPVILHIHLHFPAPIKRMKMNGDRTVFGGVVISIIQEVDNDLFDPFRIAVDAGQNARHFKRKGHRLFILLRAMLEIGNGAACDLADIQRLTGQCDTAGFDT